MESAEGRVAARRTRTVAVLSEWTTAGFGFFRRPTTRARNRPHGCVRYLVLRLPRRNMAWTRGTSSTGTRVYARSATPSAMS